MLVAMALTRASLTRALVRPRSLQFAHTALNAFLDLARRSSRIPSGRRQLSASVIPRYLKCVTYSKGVEPHSMVPWQLMSMTFVLVVLMVRSFSAQKMWKQDSSICSWDGPAAIRATSSA